MIIKKHFYLKGPKQLQTLIQKPKCVRPSICWHELQLLGKMWKKLQSLLTPNKEINNQIEYNKNINKLRILPLMSCELEEDRQTCSVKSQQSVPLIFLQLQWVTTHPYCHHFLSAHVYACVCVCVSAYPIRTCATLPRTLFQDFCAVTKSSHPPSLPSFTAPITINHLTYFPILPSAIKTMRPSTSGRTSVWASSGLWRN